MFKKDLIFVKYIDMFKKDGTIDKRKFTPRVEERAGQTIGNIAQAAEDAEKYQKKSEKDIKNLEKGAVGALLKIQHDNIRTSQRQSNPPLRLTTNKFEKATAPPQEKTIGGGKKAKRKSKKVKRKSKKIKRKSKKVNRKSKKVNRKKK